METLEIDKVSSQMIRFALKSEIFYAFPLSYMISILNKLSTMDLQKDKFDFIKTI